MTDTQPDADNTLAHTAPGDEPDTSPAAEAENAPESLSEAENGFPRDYVEKLRRENAAYRQKAKDAEQSARDADAFAQGFAKRLHLELVRATGLLADPTDMEFSIEHLVDDDALREAIDRLLADKPHLRSRKPNGDVGQGGRGEPAEFSLLDVLKNRA